MNEAKQPKSTKNGLLRYVVMLIPGLFLVGEVAVRVMSYQPWSPTARQTTILNGDHLYEKDEQLGYKQNEGSYQISLNDELQFVATHNEFGNRICSDSTVTDSLSQLWILGGSFTYGWGVNDHASFPFQFQKANPNYAVENFGVGGYGTLQSFLQFESALRFANQKPILVVLAYASFHDQRNTCNRFWRKAIAPQTVLEGLGVPAANLEEENLNIQQKEMKYKALPGASLSAFMNFWDDFLCRKEEEKLRSELVSQRIIIDLQKLCKNEGIEFICVGIAPDNKTKTTLNVLSSEGVWTDDISVEYEKEGLNLLPVDPHPNEKAHKLYSEKLTYVLKDWMAKH